MRLRFSVPAALASGALLVLAFPSTSLRIFAVIAPAMLLLICLNQSARAGFASGMAFGIGFFVPLLAWLQHVGLHAWLVLSGLEALLMGLLGLTLALVTRLRGWPLWSAAAWVAVEAVRARLPFGGFTWGRLAFSQDSGVFTRWAGVGGAPLVSFLVALAAGLLAYAVLRLVAGLGRFGRGRLAGGAALAGGVAIALSGLALPHPATGGERIPVAVVQGNVPRLGLGFNEQRLSVTTNHRDATLDLAQRVADGAVPEPRFVIWPENATDVDPIRDSEYRALVTTAVQAIDRPVLIGAVLDSADERSLNAGLVWDPQTGPGETYAKRHLVPFGEYVPLRSVFGPLSDQLKLVGTGFAPGDKPGLLRLDGVPVGDVICFEVAYDGLVRDVVNAGAQVLVVQTNNATYEPGDETYQQLAMGRFRAVETNRTVLVAATSGVSAVIAPDGTVTEESEVFTRALLVRDISLRTNRTLAVRLGVLPELVLSAVVLVPLGILLAGWLRRRQERRTEAAVEAADDVAPTEPLVAEPAP
jgi:apolipoprotein N-acyltransferase